MARLSVVTEPEIILDDPSSWQSQHPFLAQNVRRIVIPDLNLHRGALAEPVNVRDGDLHVHVFHLTETGPENELLEGGEEELAAGNRKCGIVVCANPDLSHYLISLLIYSLSHLILENLKGAPDAHHIILRKCVKIG